MAMHADGGELFVPKKLSICLCPTGALPKKLSSCLCPTGARPTLPVQMAMHADGGELFVLYIMYICLCRRSTLCRHLWSSLCSTDNSLNVLDYMFTFLHCLLIDPRYSERFSHWL